MLVHGMVVHMRLNDVVVHMRKKNNFFENILKGTYRLSAICAGVAGVAAGVMGVMRTSCFAGAP